jgi:drug/metabolite transporter (DMT)-like permease
MAAAALLLALQSLLLVPAALIRGQLAVPGTLWRAEDFALLGAGVFTAVFYLSAFELQRRGGPVVVSQLGYVITVASILIGLVVFGERPSLGTMAAVVVVLLGVALTAGRSWRYMRASNANHPRMCS